MKCPRCNLESTILFQSKMSRNSDECSLIFGRCTNCNYQGTIENFQNIAPDENVHSPNCTWGLFVETVIVIGSFYIIMNWC